MTAKSFSTLCQHDRHNPCLDGTFHDNTRAAMTFAAGNANALIGYSERLHFVLDSAKAPSTILISSAPIGDGRFPVLFTDAFVLRYGAEEPVIHAAEAFVSFMNSPHMQAVLMMSGDAARGATPSLSHPRDTKRV